MNFLDDARNLAIPSDLTFKSISEEAKHIIGEFDPNLGESKVALVTDDARS